MPDVQRCYQIEANGQVVDSSNVERVARMIARWHSERSGNRCAFVYDQRAKMIIHRYRNGRCESSIEPIVRV